MINRTKLIEVIGRTPGIRTVQICDQMDCDIEELEDVLAIMTEPGGPVAMFDVTGPNDRAAKAFRLAGAEAPAVIRPPVAKTMTKVEKAVAFIEAQPERTATASQLHKVLELKETDVPSSYLAGGVKDGRLVKDGKNWTLGTGAPAQKVEAPKPAAPALKIPEFLTGPKKQVDTPKPTLPPDLAAALSPEGIKRLEESEFNVQVTTKDPSPVVEKQVAKIPPQPIKLAPGSGFACAIWSDGEMHIARWGMTLAKLSVDETRQMRDYLDRVASGVAA